MATIPADLKYSSTHEWVRVEGEIATIGITDHAQMELGDIVYLNLTEVGRMLKPEEQFGEVESVKAVSDLFSPISGEVVATNTAIIEKTDVINTDPFGEGWLVKIRLSDNAQLSELMDATDYAKFANEGTH